MLALGAYVEQMTRGWSALALTRKGEQIDAGPKHSGHISE
jgi:hypothetical protein